MSSLLNVLSVSLNRIYLNFSWFMSFAMAWEILQLYLLIVLKYGFKCYNCRGV